MFDHIMVPIDLGYVETLEPALAKVADLARHYNATITYVGVTSNSPNSVARTPEEYQQKLEAFAQKRHAAHGRPVAAKVYRSTDPIANLDDLLLQAVDDVGADLVIMATHLPRSLDIVLPAHGGTLASRTSASVFLLRHDQG
ncbi:universal stress protein [Halomonas piscis]|uniref:Universal stress protein n=1 Tax=Halomonas piscis TaxID=3031727 RepID=A0ABY9Z2T1_9GAMM|nr:universal stress protein [Halomonas piscis]WNK20920.1 universal stress protein [Halomonas piscis]